MRPNRTTTAAAVQPDGSAGNTHPGAQAVSAGESATRNRELVVAVVTYNSADHLPQLLASIPAAAAGLRTRVIVVDNASEDATVSVARSWPGVTVVEAGANLGYSGAINVARSRAGTLDAFAVLNPDLKLHPRALTLLVGALRDPKVGVAVPTLVEGDGRVFPHLRNEASVSRALGDALFGSHWPGRPRFLTEVLRRPDDYRRERDVAWAGGAALVISAECNERVGAWDSERYFLYSEETDYARRARDLGFHIRFIPAAGATHEGAGSGQSAALLALMSVNRVRYFESHHGRLQAFAFRMAVALMHLLRARDPHHRAALRCVLFRRRWSDLPSAGQIQISPALS